VSRHHCISGTRRSQPVGCSERCVRTLRRQCTKCGQNQSLLLLELSYSLGTSIASKNLYTAYPHRFISPAIVAPEIVDVEVPKDDGVIRRGLKVIAKVVQNLANNIFFAKEAHMVVLNDFLKENITNVTRYLSEVNVSDTKHHAKAFNHVFIQKYSAAAAEEQSGEWLGMTADDTDTIVLHRFLDKHADKIGKELLSYVKPSNEENSATIGAKRAWDHLCSLLVELQEAPEVPRFSQYWSSDHRDFISLMNRCSHRSIESVRDIFVPADAPTVRIP